MSEDSEALDEGTGQLAMASPTRISIIPLSMPGEILQDICQYLDQPDLKNCRVAFKALSLAADIFLYRQVLLRRNVESFLRLHEVANHHRFSKLVKAICYSGLTVSSAQPCMDFKDWYKSFADHDASTDSWTRAVHEHTKSLTLEQIQVHYQNYLALYRNEVLMDTEDPETQELSLLTHAFAKLPQLDEVNFSQGIMALGLKSPPTHFDQLSSIQRHTFVRPTAVGSSLLHSRRFRTLLEAARITTKPLKIIKAVDVPTRYFQHIGEMIAMATLTAKSCQHLALDVARDSGIGPISRVGKIFSSAPFLHTLELSFSDKYESSCYAIKLSELFGAEARWPNLQRLRLQGVTATMIGLANLLTTHVATLRSLELGLTCFRNYRNLGKECHTSWQEMIMFLQTSLNLKNVRLGGYTWTLCDKYTLYPHYSHSHSSDAEIYPTYTPKCLKENSRLARCIERFIIDGGTYPLPMIREGPELGG